MKGLMWKELYLSAGYCRAFLVIVVVFLAVSFLGENNLFFLLYPILIAGILPVSLAAYDERDKWTQYSGTLPCSRAQLVSAKYLIGLLFAAAALTVSIAATAVRMAVQGGVRWEQLGIICAVLCMLGLIGPSLILPFVFRYGSEKGRIAFYVLVGAGTAAGVLLTGAGFQFPFLTGGIGMPAAVCAAAAVLYLLSWRISIHVYQKREL